jgi:hypothetical protein
MRSRLAERDGAPQHDSDCPELECGVCQAMPNPPGAEGKRKEKEEEAAEGREEEEEEEEEEKGRTPPLQAKLRSSKCAVIRHTASYRGS